VAVWDPAIVLCQYLDKNPVLVAGKRILEVGAGHAVVSVVASLLGAAHVVATDYSEEVLISLVLPSLSLYLRADNRL
jgi:nicotinamide N-methyltransferase